MRDLNLDLTLNGLVAGVDEVGRGPLVGEVVAAAVILDPARPIDGLTDSKKLSEKRRGVLSEIICRDALCWAIGVATPDEIDELNILHASMLAMQRAVESLSVKPILVQVDGNRCPELSTSVEAIVKGDAKVPAIGAASIIAKVYRDQQMYDLDLQFPQYGFARHKGYPTAEHLKLLQRYGVLPHYRKSFGPVKRLLEEQG